MDMAGIRGLDGGGGSRWGGLYAHNHLLASEERVADELARAQGDLAFRHDCGDG